MTFLKKVVAFIKDPLFRSKPTMDQPGRSFTTNIIRKVFRGKRNKTALIVLFSLITIAVFADLLANERPMVMQYSGSVYFPACRGMLVDVGWLSWPEVLQNADWKSLNMDWSFFPPVPYSPQNLDMANIHSVGPFEEQNVASLRWRHWLGTDEFGRDVLAGMIHGARMALTVGLISMGIASLIGLLLGSLAGYFGDHTMRTSRASVFFVTLFALLGGFWAFHSRHYHLVDALETSMLVFIFELMLSLAIMTGSILLGWLIAKPFKYIPWVCKAVDVPVDIIISRLIEVVVSIPTLFLIISISALISKPSVYMVMAVIGLTSWPGIARFVRAEMLRIRSLEYVEAARAMGYSEWRVIVSHALPNALGPVFITVAFGIASAVLIESTLSFLGVGVSAETVTWGSMLAAARQSSSAWWMALLPGGAIFVTVLVFNLIGEALTDALNPKAD